MSKFAIASNRVVTPIGVMPLAIVIESGRIAELIPLGNIPREISLENFGDSVIMPGIIDTHVHINEPGRENWEGFKTATQAAAAGGVTTLVDMPLNSTPATTAPGRVAEKITAAAGKLWVDVGFHGGLVPENANSLMPLLKSGVIGIKAFLVHSGVDDFPNVGESELRAGMKQISKTSLALLTHAELDGDEPKQVDGRSYKEYLASRPQAMELRALELLIGLCREYNCPLHVVHLSAAEALPMLQKAKSEGLPITVETCPHYLAFAAENIPDGDTRFKCAPPIRDLKNRELLWNALEGGVIDMIASDHSPCDPDLKQLETGDYTKAWGGIAGLQFTLPVVWTGARFRGHSFASLVRWLCETPAKLVGLSESKGKIKKGYLADLVVWNPDGQVQVTEEMIFHRHKVSPYTGKDFFGAVVSTFVRGEKVYDGKTVSKTPLGKIILSNRGDSE